MKKLISVLLAALLLLSLAVPALAEDGAGAKELQFRADGGFRILNICDIQDIYPMNQTTHAFIEEALALYKPDLVILGGDNCVAPQENKEAAIKEICDLFVNADRKSTRLNSSHRHTSRMPSSA